MTPKKAQIPVTWGLGQRKQEQTNGRLTYE